MIVHSKEKRAGMPFRLNEGTKLLSFMAEAGVCDVGVSGSKFTWCNNRQG